MDNMDEDLSSTSYFTLTKSLISRHDGSTNHLILKSGPCNGLMLLEAETQDGSLIGNILEKKVE